MQNYLAHHGIKDQKWYVRRFQNEDGSLTPEGKERYGEWNPGKRKKTTLKEVRNKDGNYRYNIESEDGNKVGNISTYHQSDDSLRVSWISVDKNHKREGYASGAMDTLFNQAKEKGYKKVTVVIPKDDTNVQHIYERLGFKPSNDGLTNDEVADSITSLGEVIKMEYELKHSDTLDDVLDEFLSHSAKGTVWKDHKYIKKENGRYYYADDKKLSKTSRDELMDEIDAIQQQMAFCDQKAKEYDALAKSNPDEAAEYKAQAKKYRNEIERLNDEREIIAKGLKKKDSYDEQINDLRNEPILDTLNKYKKSIYLGNPYRKVKHSEELFDDFLMHYGVGPDDNPPGRGSGRYPKGSGERPYQHDENKDAGEKKKKGLFSALGAIHKALNPGFSAVDKAAEEAGRKLKEKEEAAKKTEEEKVEYDTDRPQLMREIDSPEWHDKTSVEKIKSIEKEWLNTDGDYAIYIRDPKYRETVRAAADLGLKAVEKLRGPGYIDPESDPENEREWFLFEDQTTGMPAVANFINKGYSAKQVKYIIDEIDKANDDPDTKDIFWNNHCTFQVWEGNYNDELKLFAQYCEDIKLGGKGIKHSDLLDDFLAHYGVGPDDNPPGRGSGRYPKGSGENPYQHDPEMLAKKKKGLFSGIKTALAKRKANTEIDKYRDYVHGMLNGSLKNNKALHEKYKELNEKTDGKEFDRGPFRYQYNVPDELSGKETDREKLAAEWKKFSEEVVDKHAKAEAKSEALNKAREAKAAKAEREAEKAKAIATGDPEQISKWLSEMSNQEQIDAINRIRNTQDIKDKAAAQVKAREDAARAEEQRIASQKAAEEARRKAEEEANRPKTKEEIRKEKYEKFMSATERTLQQATRIRDMAEKGIDIWNTIAAFNNTFNDEHEMPMIKRTDAYFKEKADKEAAKLRREQQLEDAKTKRENELADALRKEQREDEKWEKEFQAKYNKNSKDVDIKSSKSDNKSEPPKESSSETSKSAAAADYDGNDWYTPAQSIARKLLTSNPEQRKEAAETGVKYWMTVLNGGNQALNPSTEKESNTAHYRDMVNERARYNEWESKQAKNSAGKMKEKADSDFLDREWAKREEQRRAEREAQKKEYERAQKEQEANLLARKLRLARETEEAARRNAKNRSVYDAGHKMYTGSEAASRWDKMAREAETSISDIYDEIKKKGLDLDEVLKKAK